MSEPKNVQYVKSVSIDGVYGHLRSETGNLVEAIDERLKELGLICSLSTTPDTLTHTDLLMEREKMKEAMKRLINEWDMLPHFARSSLSGSFVRAITDIRHLSG